MRDEGEQTGQAPTVERVSDAAFVAAVSTAWAKGAAGWERLAAAWGCTGGEPASAPNSPTRNGQLPLPTFDTPPATVSDSPDVRQGAAAASGHPASSRSDSPAPGSASVGVAAGASFPESRGAEGIVPSSAYSPQDWGAGGASATQDWRAGEAIACWWDGPPWHGQIADEEFRAIVTAYVAHYGAYTPDLPEREPALLRAWVDGTPAPAPQVAA
jgi:hypothetical protein